MASLSGATAWAPGHSTQRRNAPRLHARAAADHAGVEPHLWGNGRASAPRNAPARAHAASRDSPPSTGPGSPISDHPLRWSRVAIASPRLSAGNITSPTRHRVQALHRARRFRARRSDVVASADLHSESLPRSRTTRPCSSLTTVPWPTGRGATARQMRPRPRVRRARPGRDEPRRHRPKPRQPGSSSAREPRSTGGAADLRLDNSTKVNGNPLSSLKKVSAR